MLMHGYLTEAVHGGLLAKVPSGAGMTVVSYLIWMLGTELESSAVTVHAFSF